MRATKPVAMTGLAAPLAAEGDGDAVGFGLVEDDVGEAGEFELDEPDDVGWPIGAVDCPLISA